MISYPLAMIGYDWGWMVEMNGTYYHLVPDQYLLMVVLASYESCSHYQPGDGT